MRNQIKKLPFIGSIARFLYQFYYRKRDLWMYSPHRSEHPLSVCIVHYNNRAILKKFTIRLYEGLEQLKVNVVLSIMPKPEADINHHIIYSSYHRRNSTHHTIDTLMLTHLDNHYKRHKLHRQLRRASMGICMSKATVDELAGKGIPRQRLCYVNPAHDFKIRPRKIRVGIMSRLYLDRRKREYLIIQLARRIDPTIFQFVIMGDGWEGVVANLRSQGIAVEYHDQFEYARYCEIMPSLDYYLYTGLDEGSMGFVDALAAGVKTIVTPQGFHLDAPSGITHAFTTLDDLSQILAKIAEQKQNLIRSVADWTWTNYAQSHLMIWRYLYCQKHGAYFPESLYPELERLGVVTAPIDPLQFRKRLHRVMFGT